jgi:hypothetical protein
MLAIMSVSRDLDQLAAYLQARDLAQLELVNIVISLIAIVKAQEMRLQACEDKRAE